MVQSPSWRTDRIRLGNQPIWSNLIHAFSFSEDPRTESPLQQFGGGKPWGLELLPGTRPATRLHIHPRNTVQVPLAPLVREQPRLLCAGAGERPSSKRSSTPSTRESDDFSLSDFRESEASFTACLTSLASF
jgi:hypothetical protein